MIARIWHGWTGADRADEVVAHLWETTIAGYVSTPGNVSAVVLRRPSAGGVELMSLSVWDSAQAVPASVDENHPLLVARQTIPACWELVETQQAVAEAA